MSVSATMERCRHHRPNFSLAASAWQVAVPSLVQAVSAAMEALPISAPSMRSCRRARSCRCHSRGGRRHGRSRRPQHPIDQEVAAGRVLGVRAQPVPVDRRLDLPRHDLQQIRARCRPLRGRPPSRVAAPRARGRCSARAKLTASASGRPSAASRVARAAAASTTRVRTRSSAWDRAAAVLTTMSGRVVHSSCQAAPSRSWACSIA